MATNIPNIYAIGDVTGKLLLAHVASTQGIIAAESIAGLNPQPIDYINMPKATYSSCHISMTSSWGMSLRRPSLVIPLRSAKPTGIVH